MTRYNGVIPQTSQLGALDTAMIADFSSNFATINQSVIDNAAASQLAPPPLPPDPSSKVFFRLAVNAKLDSDFDGIPDVLEYQNGNSSSFSHDSDGDGFSDGAENNQGTNPNDANDKPEIEALIVTGNAEAGVEISQKRKIIIPAGSPNRLIVVALQSDEYPSYTSGDLCEGECPFNDQLRWLITLSNGETISGQVDVNDLHETWETESDTFLGRSPVYFQEVKVVESKADQDVVVEVEVGATNIEDGALPSTVMVGLVPVEIQVRKPQGGGWVTTNELKVAKWENAWDAQGQFRQDFIDTSAGEEIDRFRIRINMENLPAEYRKFYISSKGAGAEYNDDATEILLTKDPGAPSLGIASDGFVSKPIILVADTEDNKFKGDNIQNDQTHIVALGSEVEFRIKEPTGDIVAELPVKKRGTINLKSYIVSPNGQVQEALIERAWQDIKVANEIYSQIGLEVNAEIEFVSVPAGVDLSNGLTLSTAPNITTLGSEGLALLNAYSTPNNQADVIGIYVEAFINTAIVGSGRVQGIAFPKGWQNADKFKRTFLVTAHPDEYNVGTWSHELGHILLDFVGGNLSNHFSEPRNLMRASGSYQGNPYTDRKRLTQWQEEQMFKFNAIQKN
ncbi:MAG: hypothetical protein HN867_05590 [Deltaproteobacteria bacterium]|jgi:hypothetical protein|nr:hypothetical protein [Deltaproteobacteria bacterium]